MHSRQARRVFGGVIVVALIAIGSLVATQWATNALRKQVVALLGPTGHAAHIDVSLRQIVLDDVAIGGPPGWPAPQTLRAKRITLTLAPLALLHHQVVIRDAAFDTPYLSLVRGTDRRIALLPNLQARQAPDGTPPAGSSTPSTSSVAPTRAATPDTVTSAGMAPSTPSGDTSPNRYPVTLEKITIQDGTLDFFDRRVSLQARIDTPTNGAGQAAAPYRLTFDHLQASLGPLQFPAIAARTVFSISANARDAEKPAGADATAPTSPSATGSPVHLDGWIVLATQQSDIRTRFSNVDVRTLTPYLDPHGTIAFESGRAALSAHSTVQNRQLQANGSLTLEQIEVARGHGPASALQTLTREAVLTALQDRKGRISLDFTLSGNLSDPAFSLDETLSTRIVAGLAKVLGVNAEGVARSVGDTTKGLGEALRGLLGK